MFSLLNGTVIEQDPDDTTGDTVNVLIIKQEPERLIYDFRANDAAGKVYTTSDINNSGVEQSKMACLSNGVAIKEKPNDTASGTANVPIVKQEPELVIYDFLSDDAAGLVHSTAEINNGGVKQSPMASTSKRISETTRQQLESTSSDSDENDESIESNPICKPTFNKTKLARITGSYIVNIVNSYDDYEFEKYFRLKRLAFEQILQEVTQNMKEKSVHTPRAQVDIKIQLLIVFRLLGTQDTYTSVGVRFGLTVCTVTHCFFRIVRCLCRLAPQHVKWPTPETMNDVKEKFNSPIFKNVIGCIGATYVRITAPKHLAKGYTTRKWFTAMSLQGICDNEMRFLDVYAGWPGSVSDKRVFRNSNIYRTAATSPNLFPNGEYILGNKAYQLLDWCIPPYIENQQLTRQQELFNLQHDSCRQVIERSYALLFGRFRRLKFLFMHKTMDLIPSTIVACCALHNICLEFDNDMMIQTYIRQGQKTVIANSITNSDDGSYVQKISPSAKLKRDLLCNAIVN